MSTVSSVYPHSTFINKPCQSTPLTVSNSSKHGYQWMWHWLHGQEAHHGHKQWTGTNNGFFYTYRYLDGWRDGARQKAVPESSAEATGNWEYSKRINATIQR